MSLLRTLARWVPDNLASQIPFLANAKPSLPRQEALALRPVRNPVVQWERKPPSAPRGADAEDADLENAEIVVLTVPRRGDRISAVLSRMFQIPATRNIELDEFGSEIWELCDGSRAIAQLVQRTADTYRLNHRQAEVSVTAFMRILAQRRLVGFVTDSKKSEGKGPSHGNSRPQPPAGAKRQRTRGPRSRRN